MKVTDLSLIFLMIFLSLTLICHLNFFQKKEEAYTEEEYNRIVDRAVSDALEDGLSYEDEGGRVIVNPDKVFNTLEEELYFFFNAHVAEDRMKVRDCIAVGILMDSEGYYIYGEETGHSMAGGADEKSEEKVIKKSRRDKILFGTCDALNRQEIIRDELEYYVNQNTRNQNIAFTISFPSLTKEAWYEPLYGPQLILVFKGLPAEFPDDDYLRISISGSRLNHCYLPLLTRFQARAAG